MFYVFFAMLLTILLNLFGQFFFNEKFKGAFLFDREMRPNERCIVKDMVEDEEFGFAFVYFLVQFVIFFVAILLIRFLPIFTLLLAITIILPIVLFFLVRKEIQEKKNKPQA